MALQIAQNTQRLRVTRSGGRIFVLDREGPVVVFEYARELRLLGVNQLSDTFNDSLAIVGDQN